jgi:hypothetical protein
MPFGIIRNRPGCRRLPAAVWQPTVPIPAAHLVDAVLPETLVRQWVLPDASS